MPSGHSRSGQQTSVSAQKNAGVGVSETHSAPPLTAPGQRAQSREIRTGGPVCPRANQHSVIFNGLSLAAWANFPTHASGKTPAFA
jgi:hypothetical protein